MSQYFAKLAAPLPVVLKPKLLAFLNRWHRSCIKKSQVARDTILFLFASAVMWSIYHGTFIGLERANSATNLAYLPPSLPLGLVLLFLMLMLLFSSCLAALGSLYLGRDLDLILASPIGYKRFYSGKLLEIFGSSSWMAIIFGLPALIGFADWYNANWQFWIVTLAACLPYFLIPSTLAIALVTIFTVFVPANRTREVLLVALAMILIAIYLVIKLVTPEDASLKNLNDILKIVSVLSLPNTSWMPSYWFAATIGPILEHKQHEYWPYLLMLYSVALTLFASSYLLIKAFHFKAYSKAKDNQHKLRLASATSQRLIVKLTPFIKPQFRALIVKELKIFSRDMTQAIQLLLLLGLTMVYLYNFQVLHNVEQLPEQTKLWWQGFLVGTNLAMGAFVMTAVCTRFVFPSVSLEGQSFWIIQTSPLSIKNFLRAKFWCWYFPVAIISSVIFGSGALAINAEPHIVIINILTSWVVCYGIVGLAVGLGAIFANFDWEHTSQLAASFGSLIFMLSATVLIAINLLPSGLLIFLRTLKLSGYGFTNLEWYLTIASTSALLTYINYCATRWALNAGVNALRARFV